MPDIQIEFTPVADKLVESGKVRETAMQIFGDTTHGAVGILHPEVIKHTPHFLGYLARSIAPGVVISTNQIIGNVQTSVRYAQPVETGSKPHWPPIAPLRLWAKRKLGDERLAFAVARAIARRGTRGAHMFEKAFTFQRGRVESLFERAIDKFLKLISDK